MEPYFDTRARPWLVWVGFALVGIALALLPFALAQVGTTWVRITNYAILYVLLALGLNIVVGFAGLLDLGYIAFYAVGAYTYALLASPQFNVHLPFWVVLPIGAAVAALFGVLLGAPTLKLRGDYLAIVTLGFGEIVRIFLNNLSRPVNITNGPQGIARIDPFTLDGFSFGTYQTFLSLEWSGPIKYYYLLLLVALGIIVVNVRLQNSRVGRAWEAIREDEIAARAMGIDTRNLKLLAFAMGASFGGVAGGMFSAIQGFISPESFVLVESINVLAMVWSPAVSQPRAWFAMCCASSAAVAPSSYFSHCARGRVASTCLPMRTCWNTSSIIRARNLLRSVSSRAAVRSGLRLGSNPS